MSSPGIIALTPSTAVFAGELEPTAVAANNSEFSLADAAIALAASRAGAIGIVNIEFAGAISAAADERIAQVIGQLHETAGGRESGIKFDITQIGGLQKTLKRLSQFADKDQAFAATVILALGGAQRNAKDIKKAIDKLHALRLFVMVETVSVNEALLAETCGADAVIAKGHEAAGRVGDQTTFVLVQQCVKALKVPVWAEGGIGLHTAAACHVAGARGVVLNSQLFLTPESNIALPVKQKFTAMDGTETTLLGSEQTGMYRVFARHDASGTDSEKGSATTRDALIARLQQPATVKPLDRTWVVGQDIAFAADLTRRYSNVAGIIHAIEDSIEEHTALAVKQKPLTAGAPLAVSHGTKFPLVQGAMTRVSDTAEFALKVSAGGALPFLALALMRGSEVDALLAQTKKSLADLPWGVGILGFVPQQLRQEQMDVIRRYNPPFALIAGGRPDQAKALEEMGIKTYLHVPSPMLLESFIEMGSKRFIFEGKECGGHVGPRSSFILWEAMVEKLLSSIGAKDDAGAFHVLFAGGVHDGLSAAMVSALAAPLAARGVKVGALMGTAYLFTKEAVETGAIVKKFQEAALQCQETVLLETGPGHAIRCIQSPYKRTFDDRRNELVLQKKSRDEIREELELMNLGRLRIASKGLARSSKLDRQAVMAEFASAPNSEKKDTLDLVSDDQQWADGMYMIGQIAAMHDKVCTIEELHSQVADGSNDVLNRCEKEIAVRVSATIDSAQQKPGEPIAIVGMSCLFPKASSVEAFWQNILDKVDTITEVPIEHWDWRNYYDKDPLARDKIYSKWGGFLEDIKFDATRYGIPPSSLNSIDPMQLLLLEVTRNALEDAGYTERSFERQKTSVIVANAGHGPITAFFSLRSMLGWKLAHLDESIRKELEQQLPEWTEDVFPGYLGNVVAGRVANRFDLGGVNFTVDAACGSSLAALYVAMSELRHHNSDVVLLGATDTHNQPGDYLSFSKTHAFSAQGRCRTFDATADGIVISEGMAMLVLKRLVDAERDGDRIYAVLRGIGGSSDGRDLSLTAPRPAGQVLALSRAYEDACISPATVSLVEAHGTGTVAGDRAEIEALKQVYENAGSGKQACAVGSVKTMIGHTKCAAGLASIIKVAKALHHKVLPPTIGVTTPNPACNFESSPFYINSETRPWINLAAGANDDASAQLPRRAAVSAFGFGGTNFHTVVEEYIAPARKDSSAGSVRWPAELFILRARTRAELLRSAESLAETTKKWSKAQDVAEQDALRLVSYNNYLKQLERATTDSHDSKPAHRVQDALSLAIVASSLDDLLEKLEKAKEELSGESGKTELKDPRGIYFVDLNDQTKAQTAQGKIAFLFSGQGSQHIDMLRDLAIHFKEVRESLQASNLALRGKLSKSLTTYIYPPPAFTPEEKKRRQNELTDTQIAQPAVGAADMAMFKLLSGFGVKADMLAGHSYGEYAALCAAGAISEADLLRISEIRGRLLSYTNGDGRGSMAAFNCGMKMAQKILEHCPGITLANINSPTQCVVSGEAGKIQTAIETAKKAGVQAREIAVSQAFHSKHMAHSQAPLKAALSELQWSAPQVDVYANTDAKVYPSSTPEIVERLTEHIVLPVDFVGEIKQMHKDGATVFVEVGPGCVLAGLTDSILQESNAPSVVLSTDRPGRNGVLQLLHALAQLAALGQALDLERLYAGRISSSDCLSLKTAPATETQNKRSLTYLVNSHRIKRVGAPETAKPAEPATKAPTAATPSKPTGAQVTAPSKPTTPQPAPPPRVSVSPAPPVPTAQTPSLPPAGVASSLLNNKVSNNAPAVTAAYTPAERNSVDQVMLQFQQSMLQMTNNFLETQQNVMLAYLNGRSGAAQAPANFQTTAPSTPLDTNPGAQHTLAMMQKAIESGPSNVGPIDFAPAANAPAAPTHHHDQPSNGNGHEIVNGDGHGNGKSAHDAETVARIEATAARADQSAAPAYDPEQLIASLLEIVSERTGYPPDMLDPTLDLEADLGIDSIKRVEILNSFRKILPEAKQLELESGIEELAGTKTLQGIMDWLRSDGTRKSAVAATPVTPVESNGKNGNGHHGAGADLTPAAKVMLKPSEPAGKNGTGHEESITSVISRGTVEAIELPPAAVHQLALAKGVVVIVDDEHGVGEQLAPMIEQMGAPTVRINHRPGSTTSTESAADLTDEAQATALVEQLHAKHGRVAGIVQLLALNNKFTDTLQPLYSMFQLARVLERDLNRKDEQTLIVAAHQLDGKFGCDNGVQKPVQAGLAGLVKSLAKEWPRAHGKSIDFIAGTDAKAVAAAIASEITQAGPRTEVGVQGDKRYGLQVVTRPIAQGKEKSKINLDCNSVVVITGGARGITAEIAAELATLHKPKLILVGRSEKPSEEPAVTARLQSAKEIKTALIEQLKREQKQVSVAAVETVYQKLMRDREISANLSRLQELGATVEYHAVDVRDVKQFSQLIESIYERHGRIDGVIHGAGIIEDAYVKDKTIDSFRRVVETKVTSGQILARALRLDSLQFLFFFSSVVGRTGNGGQTDYVSANEIVNKLATSLNAKTSARVASLMWGPWRGGMAQPDLEAIFAKYGWAMIDPALGRQSFIRELEFGRKQDVEVLLVAEVALQPEKRGARLFDAGSKSIAPGKSEFSTTVDTENDVYLNHHTFDGVPVMPMAMTVEMMMEAAESTFPGWKAISVSNFDIPSGIVFESSSKVLSVRAEIISRSDSDITVLTSLGVGSPMKRVNFKAKVQLVREGAAHSAGLHAPEGVDIQIDPAEELQKIEEPVPVPPTVQKIYDEWFFHGPLFQGIKKISAVGKAAVFGEIAPSDPANCLKKTNGDRWVLDPILLDSAMQVGGVWARHFLEITALPTGFKKLQKFSEPSSDNLYVRALLYPISANELVCDIATYNSDGSLCFTLEGLGGVGSKSLNRLAQVNNASTGQAPSGSPK